MAHICLVLTAPTLEENIDILKKNRTNIDMVELRTDLLDSSQYDLVAEFPSRAGVPVILTCRKDIDGGKWTGSESDRRELLKTWLKGDFSHIDLEMDLEDDDLVEKALKSGTEIIRSFHDFKGVPKDLYETMSRWDGVIAKGAVYPQSSEELFELLETAYRLKKSGKSSFILLGMGDFGFPTRILAEKLGSYLTFCSDSAAPSGAPGHCSASDLNDIYRFRKISEKTVINGIIGNPVKQTKSPHLHNGWYEEKGMDAVYVPFLTDSLPWFMKIANLIGLNGCSVTVPFKSDIIPLIQKPDEAVNSIGSSNTIYRRDRQWLATNTDAFGLVKPLLDLLETETLKGKKVAVIGAGGTARAAVFALMDKGADVAVFNRTFEKAVLLAGDLGCKAYPLGKDALSALKEYSSVIVQTTSAGMSPQEDLNPLEFYDFDGSEIVYDIIYKPAVTKLMAAAEEAGCQTLGGFRMLEEQAVLQFELFSKNN